jgi:hypothetical protein
MPAIRLIGSDTITFTGVGAAGPAARTLVDLPHGEVGSVKFATDIATVRTGKNGNAIIAKNESGNQATVEIKVLRGSDDDKWLNYQLTNYKADPTKYVMLIATFVKKIGDGAGLEMDDTYTLSGGVPTKQSEVVSNVEGDVEQAISLFTFMFANCLRTM